MQEKGHRGYPGGSLDPEMPEAAALSGRVARGGTESFPGVCGTVRPGRPGKHKSFGRNAGKAVSRKQGRKKWEAACYRPGQQGEPAGSMRRQHGHPDVPGTYLRRKPCGDRRPANGA